MLQVPFFVKVTVLVWPGFMKPTFSSVFRVCWGWGSELGCTTRSESLRNVTTVPAGTVRSLNLPSQYETVLAGGVWQAEASVDSDESSMSGLAVSLSSIVLLV